MIKINNRTVPYDQADDMIDKRGFGRGSWNENEATTGFHSDKFYGVSRTLWVKLTDRDGGYDEGIAVEQCWRLSRHIAAEILQKQLFFFRQVLVACHLEQLKPERPSTSRALPT